MPKLFLPEVWALDQGEPASTFELGPTTWLLKTVP